MQIPCYLTPGQQAILNAMMHDSSSPVVANASPNGSQQMATGSSIEDKHLEHIQQEAMNYYNFYTALAQPLGSNPESSSSSMGSQKSEPIDLAISGSNTPAISGPAATRIPCDRVILQKTFELISPNYPYNYPAASDCLYSIRKASGICRLKLYFLDFQLQTTGLSPELIVRNVSGTEQQMGCGESFDYLEIDQKHQFCGNRLNGTERKLFIFWFVFERHSSYKNILMLGKRNLT